MKKMHFFYSKNLVDLITFPSLAFGPFKGNFFTMSDQRPGVGGHSLTFSPGGIIIALSPPIGVPPRSPTRKWLYR